MGFRVWGLGFRVWGLGFRIRSLVTLSVAIWWFGVKALGGEMFEIWGYIGLYRGYIGVMGIMEKKMETTIVY